MHRFDLYFRSTLPVVLFLFAFALDGTAFGQRLVRGQNVEERTVKLNLRDNIQLKALVDTVSEELGIRILYDEKMLAKQVTIRSPGEIPVESLLGLLQSVLKMNQLALADAEVSGWKRIVETTKLPQVAPLSKATEDLAKVAAASAVTQVFLLKNADPTIVDQSVKPFLSVQGANSLPLKESSTLIVTDFATNVQRIAKLIELIDQPTPEVFVEFIPVRNVAVEGIAEQVSQLLTARRTATQSRRSVAVNQATRVQNVAHDARTNQLIVVGTQETVDDVRRLVESLDVPLRVSTKVYSFEFVSASRVDELMQQLVGSENELSRYKSAIDEEANLLFVTGTTEIHQQLETMEKLLDVETARAPSPIRFYKLKNVTAIDLMETLQAIEQEAGESGTRRRDRTGAPGGRDIYFLPNLRPTLPGDVFRPSLPGDILPPPSELQFRGQDPRSGTEPGSEAAIRSAPEIGRREGNQLRLTPGLARVTADENTNTLIVIADPEVQRAYEELIRALDQRRPQVLIEAKLVILDLSDDFLFGLEVSGGDRIGLKRLFAFTSFGLSNVDPVTGALSIIPGTGLNGTLVDPDVADAVLRALTNHKRSRVLSAPRILVNDNATGILTSVREEPFASVNASNVVATTSFAGFAAAGTTISVTPHIADDGHLQLEYKVTLNSFSGEASTTADGTQVSPPPRQTNELESSITIPNNHTVVVGGLKFDDKSEEIDSFPYIEKIPILKKLARKVQRNGSTTTLFVFIRPIILQDDKFQDLRFISDRDDFRADPPGNYPHSTPLLITSPEWNNQREWMGIPLSPSEWNLGEGNLDQAGSFFSGDGQVSPRTPRFGN